MTVMTFSRDVNIEGWSTVRHHLFKETHFSYWKNATHVFVEYAYGAMGDYEQLTL